MPIGTWFTRLGGYLKPGTAGVAGGLGVAEVYSRIRSNLENAGNIDPARRHTYVSRLDEIYRNVLDGDIIGGYRDMKRLVYHMYADLLRFEPAVKAGLDDYISGDEIFTDVTFAADVAEFFPFYHNFRDRLLKLKPVRWMNRIVGADLDPVDLALMTYTGLRSGYFGYYLDDVFEQKGFTREALSESWRGMFKVILYVGIEKALTEETAPLFFDNIAFADECFRFQVERGIEPATRRVHEPAGAVPPRRRTAEEEGMALMETPETGARGIMREIKGLDSAFA